MALSIFMCRCVTWSDTDSWKDSPAASRLDPVCWPVFLKRVPGLLSWKWCPVPSWGRCVTWSDTDSGKGPTTVFGLDPIWWSVLYFSTFFLTFCMWLGLFQCLTGLWTAPWSRPCHFLFLYSSSGLVTGLRLPPLFLVRLAWSSVVFPLPCVPPSPATVSPPTLPRCRSEGLQRSEMQ